MDRRRRRGGRGRDRGAGVRRARGHRRRLRAVAGRRRRRQGDRAGRAAAPRERPEQHRLRVDGRRQGRHRRRDRRRRGRGPPADRQPAPDPEPDGGPRRHRLVQPGHRRVHDLDVEPDAAHPAPPAGRLRDGRPRAQDPLHQPGRRRRVRDEDLLLRGLRARAVRQQGARRPAGQVDREPDRELPEHDPRARPHHPPRDRGHARRRDHGSAGQDPGQPRRAPVDHRPGHPDDALRPRPDAAATRSPTSTPRSPASTPTRPSSTPIAARAGPRRPTSIERAMDLFAAEIGMDRAEIRRRNFIQPDQFPYENPSGLGTASGGAKIYIDSGNYEPAMDKALAMAGYGDLAAKKAEAKARGKLLGIGLSTYIEVCGVAPSQVDRCGRRGLGRRDVGIGQHQDAPDRQDRRHGGHPAAGPGPRDDLLPDHLPRARHPDGRHRRPALGHPGDAVRLRHVRLADLVGRQHGGDQGRRQDPREGAQDGRPHARGVGRRHRDRRRQLLRQGQPGPGQDDPGDRLRDRPRVRPAGGDGAVSRRDRLLRHAELHVAVRDPHRASSRSTRRPGTSSSSATSPSTTSARRSTR